MCNLWDTICQRGNSQELRQKFVWWDDNLMAKTCVWFFVCKLAFDVLLYILFLFSYLCSHYTKSKHLMCRWYYCSQIEYYAVTNYVICVYVFKYLEYIVCLGVNYSDNSRALSNKLSKTRKHGKCKQKCFCNCFYSFFFNAYKSKIYLNSVPKPLLVLNKYIYDFPIVEFEVF